MKRLPAVLLALWPALAGAQTPSTATGANVNPVTGSLWTYLGPTYGASWTVGSGMTGTPPTAVGHPAVWNNAAGTLLNMPDKFMMTPTITATAGDSPANSAIWVQATRSGTATGPSDNGLMMMLHNETMTNTVASRGIDTLFINHVFGGGEGSRSGIFVNIQNSAATAAPESFHQFYTAVFGNTVAVVSDSTNPAIPKGQFFSVAGQTTVLGGVKAFGAIGAEFDVGVQAGAQVNEKVLLQLITYNNDAVRGAVVDAGLVLARSAGSGATATLAQGISFGKPGTPNSWPFAADSNIIQARGTADTPGAAAANGVDFTLVNFVGCAFASKGFCVTDGIPGLLLNRPFPTLEFYDTQIASPATNGGVVRITSLGSVPDSYQWQINTAAAGNFSTGIGAFTVDANGQFRTLRDAVFDIGAIVGGSGPAPSPAANYYRLYTDPADNKLKAKASTGVVTVLASP